MIYIDTDCNAPCCPCKIVDKETGRDILVQTDWDYPGVASTFGWSVSSVKPVEPACLSEDWRVTPPDKDGWTPEEIAAFEKFEKQSKCDHDGTDGTVGCRACGLGAATFINSAREYLEDNDGKAVEDPGYFTAE